MAELTSRSDAEQEGREARERFAQLAVTDDLREGPAASNPAWRHYSERLRPTLQASGFASLGVYLSRTLAELARPIEVLSLSGGSGGQQVALVRPKVIVCLGSTPTRALRGDDMRITRDRGMWFRTEQGFDCIATYHPAYLLRQYGKQLVASKWDVFHDLEAARERAALLAPGYQFMSEEKPELFKIFKKRVR